MIFYFKTKFVKNNNKLKFEGFMQINFKKFIVFAVRFKKSNNFMFVSIL